MHRTGRKERERDKWKARDKETVVFLCTISYDRVFFPCRWLASLPGKETCTERDEEKIEKTVDLNSEPYAPISLWSTVSPLYQQKNESQQLRFDCYALSSTDLVVLPVRRKISWRPANLTADSSKSSSCDRNLGHPLQEKSLVRIAHVTRSTPTRLTHSALGQVSKIPSTIYINISSLI